MTATVMPVVPAETDPTITGLSKRDHQVLIARSGGVQFGAPRLTADRWVTGRTVSSLFASDTPKSVTGVASTGVFTAASHNYQVGDMVTLVLTAGGSGLTAGLPYYINTVPSANTFTVALTSGGSTVTYATDLTSGTVARRPDGALFDFTNLIYTTSASRPALRAADSGTSTFSSLFTKEKSFRDWDIRVRYRPANDAATSSTDYGIGVFGGWTDASNNWQVTQYHNSGNPNLSAGAQVAGTLGGAGAAADVAPRSTSQDRIIRVQKIGDLIRFKDWATNVTEPGWTREFQSRTTATTDNPERGAAGFYHQFFGGYVLEFAITELRRQSENVLHNTDLTKFNLADVTSQPRAVSGVASTGVFTTTASHGYSVGDLVVFNGFNVQTNGIGIVPGRDYYVQNVPSAATFKVSATRGGSLLTFSTDMAGGYVIKNPVPAFWSKPNGALSSGNYLEVRHIAGPDQVVRPCLAYVCATANDSNLIWQQDVWNTLNATGASGGFTTRLNTYPQSQFARRLEFSCWVKGSITTIQALGLGLTFDIYMYDGFATASMMTRQTYHPALSPNVVQEDTSTDPASYDGAETTGTFDWTYISSIVEIPQFESLNRLRAQIIFHEATDTGYVYVMDPCLRPVG